MKEVTIGNRFFGVGSFTFHPGSSMGARPQMELPGVKKGGIAGNRVVHLHNLYRINDRSCFIGYRVAKFYSKRPEVGNVEWAEHAWMKSAEFIRTKRQDKLLSSRNGVHCYINVIEMRDEI